MPCPEKERVLQRRPLWTWGADLREFVLSSVGSVERPGPLCIFRDLATDRSIELRVQVPGRCAADGAEALALALGTHDNPQLRLDNLIETWTQELLRGLKKGGEDVIGEFYRIRPLLERHLSSAPAASGSSSTSRSS